MTGKVKAMWQEQQEEKELQEYIKETYDTLGSLEAFKNFVAANITSADIEKVLGEEIEHEFSNYIYYTEK